jgi:hypothetical protein
LRNSVAVSGFLFLENMLFFIIFLATSAIWKTENVRKNAKMLKMYIFKCQKQFKMFKIKSYKILLLAEIKSTWLLQLW